MHVHLYVEQRPMKHLSLEAGKDISSPLLEELFAWWDAWHHDNDAASELLYQTMCFCWCGTKGSYVKRVDTVSILVIDCEETRDACICNEHTQYCSVLLTLSYVKAFLSRNMWRQHSSFDPSLKSFAHWWNNHSRHIVETNIFLLLWPGV